MTTRDDSKSSPASSTATATQQKPQAATTMQTDSYQKHSIHQYDAHVGCQPLLEASLQRLAQRMAFARQSDFESDAPKIWQMADLGSADGSNSMVTLQWAVHTLQQELQELSTPLPKLHITLEEHPASDESFLRATLQSHDDWFAQHNMTYSTLMKSFYEPLFPANSIDLFLCYISLHWLDTTATDTTTKDTNDHDHSSSHSQQPTNAGSKWKSWLHASNNNTTTQNSDATTSTPPTMPTSLSDFVFMNEATVPTKLKHTYQNGLAKVHLAKFLALRARELKPGAEGMLMMVSQPNDYVCPKSSSSTTASALTRAMQSCIKQGQLRRQVLEQTLIPYYLRTQDDIREALDMAATIPFQKQTTTTTTTTSDDTTTSANDDEYDYPGSLLTLVDVQSYPVQVASSSIAHAFEMFWSIHQGAIATAGATEAELECIRVETSRQFDQLYNAKDGITIHFVACVIRRRTRKAWAQGRI